MCSYVEDVDARAGDLASLSVVSLHRQAEEHKPAEECARDGTNSGGGLQCAHTWRRMDQQLAVSK